MHQDGKQRRPVHWPLSLFLHTPERCPSSLIFIWVDAVPDRLNPGRTKTTNTKKIVTDNLRIDLMRNITFTSWLLIGHVWLSICGGHDCRIAYKSQARNKPYRFSTDEVLWEFSIYSLGVIDDVQERHLSAQTKRFRIWIVLFERGGIFADVR